MSKSNGKADDQDDQPLLAWAPDGREWSRVERQVLRAWCAPDNWSKTEKDMAKASGVSRARYYVVKANPDMQEARRRICDEMLRDHLQPIYDAAIKVASEPTRHGFPDRKLLLEMARAYIPRQELTGRDGGPIEQRSVDVPPAPATYQEWLAQRIDDTLGVTGERVKETAE